MLDEYLAYSPKRIPYRVCRNQSLNLGAIIYEQPRFSALWNNADRVHQSRGHALLMGNTYMRHRTSSKSFTLIRCEVSCPAIQIPMTFIFHVVYFLL